MAESRGRLTEHFAEHGRESRRAVIAHIQRHGSDGFTGSKSGEGQHHAGPLSPLKEGHAGLGPKLTAEGSLADVQYLCPVGGMNMDIGLLQERLTELRQARLAGKRCMQRQGGGTADFMQDRKST